MVGLDRENQEESLKNEESSLYAEYESIQSIFEKHHKNYVKGAI